MPINCPIGINATCEGCRHSFDGYCYALMPIQKLSEILTIEERLEIIETREKEVKPWQYKRLKEQVQQLKGQILHLEKKVNELQQKKKGYAKY